MLIDVLEIILITYNRKRYLKRTLEQLFAENSPVRNINITILDNVSTDGSFEVIQEYAQKFPNLRHIRHNRNIGGVANSLRAFEMATKKYIWVLCDDDRYDWSNWGEVENAIEREEELICVSRYALADEDKDKLEHQMFQLTFIPAGIYKTTTITDASLRNAYDHIHSLLPQSCFVIGLINAGKRIYVIDKAIVDRSQNEPVDETFTRGYKSEELAPSTRSICWIAGYANVCSILKDNALKHRAMLRAIDYKEIHNGFENFCDYISYCYAGRENWVQVLSVFMQLDKASQRALLEHFIKNQNNFVSDEKVLYDFFLEFGAEYEEMFRLPNGQLSFNKKVYTMQLDDGTVRTISVFDTPPKAENAA